MLTGENRKYEGTGSCGRVEGSLERQDWKVLDMTREIRSLKLFAMEKVVEVSKCELFGDNDEVYIRD